ncbi:MAG: molybdopterin cofactor-binding domain-containing protein, partial [Myxococcota bacterium]
GWADSTHRVEGVFRSNGQEQFYLESQAALAIPDEDAGMIVHSSTQNPSEIQKVVAEMLGWRQNQVVCLCRRMGGAFGGKETQAALPAAFAALAAFKTKQPVRVVYTKDEDMLLTGKRHEVVTRYAVGCDAEGRIRAAEFVVRSNGGAYMDLSIAVLERTMLHLDNAYFLPHVAIAARVCRTNLPPNTAFRGFGGPQAMAVIENAIEEIALATGLDASDVRRKNLYDAEGERTTTPYGQRVENFLLPEIFERLEASADYRARKSAIETANQVSAIELRGLAITPVKFGISFTNKSLNQANALVNVYTDGTVQVSTGATEMGQGVNTKLALLVASELGVAYERVVVMPTSTEKNNNTSPTAASASTDLNGTAAVRASA